MPASRPRRGAGPASRSSRSPWSTARQDRSSRAPERLVLEQEVLGQRQRRCCLGAGPDDREVEVADLLVDRDRREGGRVDLVRHAVEDLVDVGHERARGPASRRRRCRRRATRTSADGERRPAARRGAPRLRRAAGRQPGREAAGRRRPPTAAPARAGRGAAAPRRRRPGPESSPTLVPNSSVWGAISSVLATATSTPKATRPTRPAGTVFGSVIMKNRKIRTSGEVTITRQKSTPQTGANDQSAIMQWPEPARSPTPTVSVTQNVGRQGEQMQPPRDQQAAADDHGVGRDHPGVQRRPPEVERLDARAAEHDERHDQPDVRRVEDVRAAVLDDVLRQQREAGDDREDVPAVRCSRGRPAASRRRAGSAPRRCR